MPPCTACGACCQSDEESYIGVYGIDYDRMDAAARQLVVTTAAGRYLRFHAGRCVALRFGPGGRCGCSIYAMRPDCCRALQRGTAQCREHIATKGIPTPQ